MDHGMFINIFFTDDQQGMFINIFFSDDQQLPDRDIQKPKRSEAN